VPQNDGITVCQRPLNRAWVSAVLSVQLPERGRGEVCAGPHILWHAVAQHYPAGGARTDETKPLAVS
jgi:hypothetical protein